MLLNKVLFVSLLVLGLCFLQPALGDERLAKRIAGGTQANPAEFPFVALIQYPYTVNGATLTYQGTGIIYNPTTVVTSAKAMSQCQSPNSFTIFQGVVDTLNTTGATIISVPCVPNSLVIPAGSAGNFFADLAYINVTGAGVFTGNFARLPSSSPTAADIGRLFAVGWGEIIPGSTGSPVLQYVPLNPQRNRVCNSRLTTVGLNGNISYAENFCLSGFTKSPTTGFLTDACVLDAGAPIIRTQNILSPTDHEVVGIINFSTCTDSAPTVATYLWVYADNGFLPTAGNPANATATGNPRAFDGNFACGDGNPQGGLEKCDVGVFSTDPGCCDPWTCQLLTPGTACTINNRNGTICRQQPRCNVRGLCVSKFRSQGKPCNGHNTKCHRGACIKTQ